MRRAGPALTAVGTVVALVYFFGYIPSVGWGSPGSAAYDDYARANRVFALPLLAILMGAALSLFGGPTLLRRVLFAGALLMLIGNIAEFWVFDAAAYGDGSRLLAWSTFLLGAAVFFLTLGLSGSMWLLTRAGIGDDRGDATSR